MQYSFRAPASSYDDGGDVDEDGVDEDADVDAGAGAWQSTCSSIQRTGGGRGRPLLLDISDQAADHVVMQHLLSSNLSLFYNL